MNNNGNWKLSGVSPALVISSGLVFLSNKKPKGLYLGDILEMIAEHPSRSYYCKVIPRRVTLREAIQDEQLDRLGEVRDTYSSIDLRLIEPEREFEKLPKSGRQLLENKYQSKARRIK